MIFKNYTMISHLQNFPILPAELLHATAAEAAETVTSGPLEGWLSREGHG